MSESAAPASATPVAGWRAMFSSLQEPAFRGYVSGMLFSYLPMTMQPVTMGYLAYSLTGRATDLGLVQLAWGLPMLVLTLYAGVLCDRFERRLILTISQAVIGVGTLSIAILTALGVIQIWMILVASLLIGAGFAFNLPARQGMLPQVLSRENLTNGVAVNNSFFNLCRVGGPALAGVLIAWPVFGIAGVYFMMAAAYLLSALGIFRLRVAPQIKPQTHQAVAKEIGAALHYIGRSPALLSLMAMGFIYVVIGMPYQNLMPVFAVSVFDVGSPGLGLLMTLSGVGALCGSLVMAAFSHYPNKGRLQTLAAVAFGVSLAAFALAPTFWLALALIFLVGAFSNLVMSLNNTLLMLHTDASYMGRVMSVYMLTWSIMPFSALPISASMDVFGPVATIVMCGLLVVGGVLALALVGRRPLSRAEPEPTTSAAAAQAD